ncbi:hypothetical protein pEaSNUABM11_00105 [Erwinia phage pEa_SNUABM_11]|nr:hypothetical protein pEaSNUABM11_00105 [Erwinia phage pEa_SNUABM_11]
MTYRVDLSKTAPEILINRINYVFGTSYTAEQLTFDARGAVPLSKEEARREGVESKAAAYYRKGFTGSQNFMFTRGDLNKLLKGVVVPVPFGAVQWSQDLAPYIFDELGVNLNPQQILIEPIPEDATDYTVRLIPRHLSLKGTIAIQFVDPTPRRLKTLVKKTELDGFSFPGELNG